jgi:hypothetical protein
VKISYKAFLAISLLLIVLPFCSYLPFFDRAVLYKTIDARRSLELSHYQNIFKDKEDVTIAFIGLSSMWVGIDASRVERYLAEKGLVNPKVIMIGANHPGEDIVYMMAKDLLENRSVDLIVLSNPNRAQEHFHPVFHRLASLSSHAEAWAELSIQDRVRSYALSILGAPLQLYYHLVPSYEPLDRRGLLARNGSWIRSAGWAGKKFEEFDADAGLDGRRLSEVGTIAKDGKNIDFDNVTTDYQAAYFEKTVELARGYGTDVALLATPTWYDRDSNKINVRINSSLVSNLDIPVVGVVPSELFKGMSENQIEKLYYDRNHFNSNGAKLHTRVISGTLERLLNDS